MKISDVTKQNIIDDLAVNKISWFGRLNEVDFLKRLYNLKELPSTDARFESMEGDVWQHRTNNSDWEDGWILSDSRLNIMEDDKFLKLLCETIHPVVRNGEKEVSFLLDLFNSHLNKDGWGLVARNYISGKPVFSAMPIDTNITIESKDKISHDFVKEQLLKCDSKINHGDFDGAITNSLSLLEGTFADIFERITGEKYYQTGSLQDKYKKVKHLLSLCESKKSNEAADLMLRSLVGLIDGIDRLGNMMGDRHIRSMKPEKHHAKLCVNASKTITDFLYSTLEYQFNGKEDLYQAFVVELNSEKRCFARDGLLKDKELKELRSRHGGTLNKFIKTQFINDYQIDSFRQSDIFFAAMLMFADHLTNQDIKTIFQKHETNSQACGLKKFLKEIRNIMPMVITDKYILNYINKREK